jgi:1,4-alpha-glucan branching enzyme
MNGCVCLVLHAHLPFVRHPEHQRFLEESWLYEAVIECYIPLLQVLERWFEDRVPARLTFTLTPTLCAMLTDPLLRHRCGIHLERLVELAEREVQRTTWQPQFQNLASFYHERFNSAHEYFRRCGGNLLQKFRECQERGQVEIVTSAATHALLPLWADHPPSVKAQLFTAWQSHRKFFGVDPEGIWLPECGYYPGLEHHLKANQLRWFILETQGILAATPPPRYGPFAPVLTPNRVAGFGRDIDSARQVWSRHEGYPGDPWYREFYRDIGFDLDWDYVREHTPSPEMRGFTGIKYFRITGGSGSKQPYIREKALQRVHEHACHFLSCRESHIQRLLPIMHRPPVLVCPYDAELFGHWWYEGPEFIDAVGREAARDFPGLQLITPGDFLNLCPVNQVASPAASSWGEGGYWRVWLNEKNHWIYPRLKIAQQDMTELAENFCMPGELQTRALRQAGRELLLAQASDWPFMLRHADGESYAKVRVEGHLANFTMLNEQLKTGAIDEVALRELEVRDNIFPELDYTAWRTTS